MIPMPPMALMALMMPMTLNKAYRCICQGLDSIRLHLMHILVLLDNLLDASHWECAVVGELSGGRGRGRSRGQGRTGGRRWIARHSE